MSQRYRMGFDIGGTFTDFVLVDTLQQRTYLHKCLTTPADPSEGALAGMATLLDELSLSHADVDQLVHGTTLVTNAVIERNGCRLGLLTTKGFRDVLAMGTEQRYDIHDLFLQFPEPLAPRQRRLEVVERMDRDGRVVTALDEDQARAEIQALLDDGVEAIAVCFLHAYKNPSHEQRLHQLIRAAAPQLPVSLSHKVHPEIREYQRTATTAVNAYVQPLMRTYLERLMVALKDRGFTGRFHLLQSSGGLSAPDTAMEFPVRFLESGPAGGARATAFIGAGMGVHDTISFDMGGTTAKACLIQGGTPDIAAMLEAGRVHRFKRGSGLPVHAPVTDMIEIGAGGGSIAWIDAMGLLKVGPASAGADPGPACYGRGGTDATVTDANLLLGYLDPEFFVGGTMPLDVAAAERALTELGQSLGMSARETAAGIIDLVVENMAGAARVHIVEKGRDPRRYAMVAMGGAGPLHAVQVAQKLGLQEVIVPPASGAASALGFLAAPISYEVSRSEPMALDEADFAHINRLFDEMIAECTARLQQAGGDVAAMDVQRFADMRLDGQMHEIAIALPKGTLTTGSVAELYDIFKRDYTERYTHLYDGARIQVMHWRVRCQSPSPALVLQLHDDGGGDQKIKGHRQIGAGKMQIAPVFDRYALRPGDSVTGPAVIEERESTTLLPDGVRATVDGALNVRITLAPNDGGHIVVASDTALDAAVQRIEQDPIGLEIMWRRLINIAEECWHTVIRTAFSLIIGEAQDFACEILDARGRQIVHSPRAMPVFNLTLPMAVNAMIERISLQNLHEGDVLITNDPWLCAGHLFDIAIAVPVFREGRVVAFVGIVGHVTDIGGTKDELSAQEIYDEGIQIPPMKLFKAGVANDDLLTLLAENVRRADQVLGDIHALVAAGTTGAAKVQAFMSEYGMHDLEALAYVVQQRSEQAMRQAVQALPDGQYTHHVTADGLDDCMTFPIQIAIQGDAVAVQFDGAPPQTERGGSNCTLSYTMAHATYPLKCILTPEIPGNAGCYRPMAVSAPKSSILNCDKPKAVNTRVRTGWYIAPNVFGALAEAAPDKVQAFTGLPSSALFYGTDQDGKTYSDHLFQGGGQGGSQQGDGHSALLYPTSAANTSIELLETRVPALVEEKALVPDSGGPGLQRGGLGQIVVVRKLSDDEPPCQVGLYPNGVTTAVPGLFGGKAGALARAWVCEETGIETDLGVGGLSRLCTTTKRAYLRLAGGAGFGDPWRRAFEEVERDVQEGVVSPEAARRDYGCVVRADGHIDRAASQELRQKRRSAT